MKLMEQFWQRYAAERHASPSDLFWPMSPSDTAVERLFPIADNFRNCKTLHFVRYGNQKEAEVKDKEPVFFSGSK